MQTSEKPVHCADSFWRVALLIRCLPLIRYIFMQINCSLQDDGALNESNIYGAERIF